MTTSSGDEEARYVRHSGVLNSVGFQTPASPIRITQIIARLRPEDGGPFYSVPSLAAALERGGADVLLRCTARRGASPPAFSGFKISVHTAETNIVSRLFCVSTNLSKALDNDARAGSLLHVHGLWFAPSVYPAWAKRRAGGRAKLMHSPRGMLGDAALKISRWKKKAAWFFAQHSALLAADCLHATAFSELEEIRSAGLTAPVAVIPNGIDLPILGSAPRPSQQENVMLSLGRVHPKKGLDKLVRAWALIESNFPSWRLRIVGPAELGHDEELRALCNALGVHRVNVEGPQYGDAKVALFRRADVFVLPTLNENFAMTVAEALASQIPVISTKGAPWAGMEREGCGWWIDHGIEPLADAMRCAMQLPRDERLAMGARGRLWMARDFSWDRIAADMLDVYRWLQVGGEPPATVHTI